MNPPHCNVSSGWIPPAAVRFAADTCTYPGHIPSNPLFPKNLPFSQQLSNQTNEARAAAYDAQTAQPSTFGPPGTTPLGKALGNTPDPIAQAVSGAANQRYNDALQRRQATATQLVATYQKIATLQPTEPASQLQLAQAAQDAGVRAHLAPLVADLGTVAGYVPLPNEPGGAALPEILASAARRLLLPVLRPDRDLDWAVYTGVLVPAGYGLREPSGPRLGPARDRGSLSR